MCGLAPARLPSPARLQPTIVTSRVNRLRNVRQAVLFHDAALHGENRLLRTVQMLQQFLETRFIELPNPGEGVTLCRCIARGVDLFKAGEGNRGWLRLDHPEVNLSLEIFPMNPTPPNANTPVSVMRFTAAESASCAAATLQIKTSKASSNTFHGAFPHGARLAPTIQRAI